MSQDRKSIEEFLLEIDQDLMQYSKCLRQNGFTSTKSLKYINDEDLTSFGIPEGHKRLILNMVTKLKTPERKTKRINLPSPCKGDIVSPDRKRILTETNSGVGATCGAINDNDQLVRRAGSTRILSPAERYIGEKRREIEDKRAEINFLNEEFEEIMSNVELAAKNTGDTGQRCSKCHTRNHTVRTCPLSKCESVYFCGDLSKHPEEKLSLQQKRRQISALESSVTKLQQELKAREDSHCRVQCSANKALEDRLLDVCPNEYFDQDSKNWLKIQQDVAYLKKSVKGAGLPSRETIKSALEKRRSSEDSCRRGLFPSIGSLSSRNPCNNEANLSATQQALRSYGVNFPTARKVGCTSTRNSGDQECVYLPTPFTEEEETEQLNMAQRLSLLESGLNYHKDNSVSDNSFDTSDNDNDAANILLSLAGKSSGK